MARVTLKNVTKRFAEVMAVDDLSLEVEDGEFLVLLGPSGCGKTTALRCIAGLEEVTSGDIYIGDRWVNEVPPKERDVAMVFQSYALYPHMKVKDNLAFGLRMRGTPRPVVEEKVAHVAQMLELSELLERKPKQLSGGQRQRVALGRAVVREPQVFLMDEPLSNLDAKLRVATRAELIKLHRELGVTTVYVTHDQVEAMTMGNRIAILHLGELQQLGTPQEVYEQPANLFVAEFIGSPSMNFYEAVLTRSNGDLYLSGEAFRLRVPKEKEAVLAGADKTKVMLGVRPEDVMPASLMSGDKAGKTLMAKVDVVEPLGNEQILYFALEKGNLVARLGSRVTLRPGEQVELAVDTERIHTFDLDSGRALF